MSIEATSYQPRHPSSNVSVPPTDAAVVLVLVVSAADTYLADRAAWAYAFVDKAESVEVRDEPLVPSRCCSSPDLHISTNIPLSYPWLFEQQCRQPSGRLRDAWKQEQDRPRSRRRSSRTSWCEHDDDDVHTVIARRTNNGGRAFEFSVSIRSNRGRGGPAGNRGRGSRRNNNTGNRNVTKEGLDSDLDKYMAQTKLENDSIEMNAV